MAVATAAFAPPPSPSSRMEDKPTYRTRLASAGASPSPRKPANMQLNVNVGAHNLRILKKAGSHADTPRSTASAPTPTSSSKQRKYERKSKRFIWPDELHRLFVAAIFDVGLKNASPKALLSIMLGAGVTSDLTTEHLKSHLQKYRLNYERSRLEFLEFYDESARRSHKRRRKSSPSPQSARSNNSSSDHNSGFVFPISHKRSRSDDDDDESSEDGNATSEVDDDTGSPTESFSEATASTSQRRREVVKAEPRTKPAVSKASPAAKTQANKRQAPQQQQAADPVAPSYTVPITPFPGHQQSSVSAALTTPASTTAPAYPALSTLNDPQWNILNSLISPQLVAHRGAHDASEGSVTASTSSSKTQAVPISSSSTTLGSLEPLLLQDTAPVDLQMQMHLAMQAQMNLHRQMLTRKVEVSQHGLPAQPQLRPQQLLQQPQQQNVPTSHWSNANQQSQPSEQQQQQQQRPQPTQQQAVTDLQSSRLLDSMLAGTSEVGGGLSAQSSYLGSLTATHSTSVSTASSAAVAPATSSALLGLHAMADFAVDTSALASLDASSAEKLDESEALADLYRWDKMDFSMEIDDDDLFGFLKA